MKGSKSVAAGVAGAVIGAGMAVAANKLMNDKKTRQKVGTVMHNIKNQVVGAAKSASDKIEEAKENIQDKAEKMGKEVKDKSK